jgi:glycosyltransferase involved in cell wall biosynthesis
MISVCMTTCNGERYVLDQIESILSQIGEQDELIISDDGSVDRTLELISQLGDKRIILLSNTDLPGVVRNVENSLRHARGEYVFLADQDDVWLPGKVARMMSALAHYDVAVADCRVTDAFLEVTNPSLFKVMQSGPGFFKNLYKNSYIGCCMAMRREVLSRALPFPVNTPMHDWWIGLIAEAVYKTKFIAEPLMMYRRHDSNASLTSCRSPFSLNQKFAWRFMLVKSLLFRLWRV